MNEWYVGQQVMIIRMPANTFYEKSTVERIARERITLANLMTFRMDGKAVQQKPMRESRSYQGIHYTEHSYFKIIPFTDEGMQECYQRAAKRFQSEQKAKAAKLLWKCPPQTLAKVLDILEKGEENNARDS
jgi:hypothetical protein